MSVIRLLTALLHFLPNADNAVGHVTITCVCYRIGHYDLRLNFGAIPINNKSFVVVSLLSSSPRQTIREIGSSGNHNFWFTNPVTGPAKPIAAFSPARVSMLEALQFKTGVFSAARIQVIADSDIMDNKTMIVNVNFIAIL